MLNNNFAQQHANRKEKAVLFGVGSGGAAAYQDLCTIYDIIAFTDNNSDMWGTRLKDMPVVAPSELTSMEFDVIVISTEAGEEVFFQLVNELHVPPDVIIKDKCSFHTKARINVLKNIAFEFGRKGIIGDVSELGVYRGEFAKNINHYFPDRQLYLFDTFEGFDAKDVQFDNDMFGNRPFVRAGHLGNTSVDLVMSKMEHPQKCTIVKGCFPDSIAGREKEISGSFVFVSIDVDLYSPALAGLQFFYPRMTKGGVILLHDYYSDCLEGYRGAMQAFDDFCGVSGQDIKYLPIGDNASIAIIK